MKHLLTLLICLLFSRGYAAAEAEQPFVVGALYGQLGNQMFQIATTVSFALDHQATPLFPDLVGADRDNIAKNYKMVFSKLNTAHPNRRIAFRYQEPRLRYDEIPYKPDMYLYGYFQSEKYFKHHRDDIVKLFAPSPSIVEYLQSNYGDIIADPKSVAIHVRTYGKEDPQHKIYELNGRTYVKQAMELFPDDYHFYVFSDDINWCIGELSDLSPNIRFMSGESYINDFYLQSMCQHHIISNSTFSWWAAWLNKNPNKIVVAPLNWYNLSRRYYDCEDLIPKEWLRVPNR